MEGVCDEVLQEPNVNNMRHIHDHKKHVHAALQAQSALSCVWEGGATTGPSIFGPSNCRRSGRGTRNGATLEQAACEHSTDFYRTTTRISLSPGHATSRPQPTFRVWNILGSHSVMDGKECPFRLVSEIKNTANT